MLNVTLLKRLRNQVKRLELLEWEYPFFVVSSVQNCQEVREPLIGGAIY